MADSQAERGRQPHATIPSRPRSIPGAVQTSRIRPTVDPVVPVNSSGCFELDRVIKSGYVQKRTGKTKKWKTVFLVLRPTALSIYKNDKESKLRHQVHLSDLTAVAFLKDPKHKRQNVFGLFSPSKNFHFEAPTRQDAQEWVHLVRGVARIEEEEEEMFLASPVMRQHSPGPMLSVSPGGISGEIPADALDRERMRSSSPEPPGPPTPGFTATPRPRKSHAMESFGPSASEVASHSDMSDGDMQNRCHGVSLESLPTQTALEAGSLPRTDGWPPFGQSISHMSVANAEQDLDRIIWQGWIWFLRSKGGVRQWKDMWGVLRARNFILYKDEAEYTAQWIAQLSAIVNVVDVDPLSKHKTHCLQIITEEKSFRFCAHDEESLVQLIGAFKSLLAKRRGLEARTNGKTVPS